MKQPNPNWAKRAWSFLDDVAAAHGDRPTPSQKKNLRRFISSVPDVLPCKKCARSFREYIKRNPPDVESTETVTRWLQTYKERVKRKQAKNKIKSVHET